MREKVHLNLILFAFVCLSFASCKQKQIITDGAAYQVSNAAISYSKISKKTVAMDSSILSLLIPYRDSMAAEMDLVIAFNEENLDKTRPNSKLGNWMTDVLHEQAEMIFNKEVDFAIQNYGGIRIPTLSKGEITKSDIFELMPFDNALVLLKLPGEIVQVLCDRIALYGGWPISYGLSFTKVDDKAVDIMLKGKPLELNQTYLMAVPDFIANGGDRCDFLKELERENSGVFIRNVLINHLIDLHASENSLVADSTERIKTN